MAEGKLQPTDEEFEIPLPASKAPDFDLSDETLEPDGIGDSAVEAPETAPQGEPEGVFALFDREFPEGEREPIEQEESGEFDREFSDSFEQMFEAIKGDGSAPLFDEKLEPLAEPQEPTAEAEAVPEKQEVDVPPIPRDLPGAESSSPDFDISDELGELTLEDERIFDELPAIDMRDDYDEDGFDSDSFGELSLDEEPLSLADEPLTLAQEEPEDEDESLPDPSAGWETDDSLEEVSFDDSEEEDLYDEDLSGLSEDEDEDEDDGFDDFARMALGLDDGEEDDDTISEEDDFKVEELTGAEELDPFEEISIMSSEDVSKFEPSFGSDELKFQDQEPLPEDPDPFLMEGENPSASADGEEDLEGLDPFSPEAAALSGAAATGAAAGSRNSDDGSADEEDGEAERKERKPKKSRPKLSSAGGGIGGILRLPWRLVSFAIDFLFGVLEALLRVLGKLPLIGLPFRVLGTALEAIPPLLKRLVVVVLVGLILLVGTSIITNLFPKPTAEINLPDSGSAKISSVELKDGKITGEIENTGDIVVHLFPNVQVAERKLFSPGSWFNPKSVGSCKGPLVDVPIDGTAKFSYDCGVKLDGNSSLKPSLEE